jgi:hypothetical protein
MTEQDQAGSTLPGDAQTAVPEAGGTAPPLGAPTPRYRSAYAGRAEEVTDEELRGLGVRPGDKLWQSESTDEYVLTRAEDKTLVPGFYLVDEWGE